MVSRHDYEKQFKSFGALSGVAELAGVIAHQSSLQQVLRGNEQMLGADVATSLPSILGRSGMRLLRPSAAALKSLHSNNRSLPSMPSMQELAVSSWGAQEVAALLSRAVVELPVDPDSDAGIAFGELLNEGAFHGNGPFHPELMSALDAIYPNASRYLYGVWESLDNRYAPVKSAANLLIEAVDWVMRSAAPEGLLNEWLNRLNPREQKRLRAQTKGGQEEGAPTLRAKVRYIRQGPGTEHRKLAENQVVLVEATLVCVRDIAQGHKHGDSGSAADMRATCSLVTFTGTLAH